MKYVWWALAIAAVAALSYVAMAMTFTWKYLTYVRTRRQMFLDNPELQAQVRAERRKRSNGQDTSGRPQSKTVV